MSLMASNVVSFHWGHKDDTAMQRLIETIRFFFFSRRRHVIGHWIKIHKNAAPKQMVMTHLIPVAAFGY